MAARPSNPALAVDILRVTAELIEEKGADQLTMREVADRLGYSATTIYLYFKDKDELIDAAIDRAFEMFADHQQTAGTSTTGVDVLKRRSQSYVEWGLEHPNLYRAMFERPQKHNPDRARLRRRSYFAYSDDVRDLMESGELKRVATPESAVNTQWAGTHGLVSLAISGRMFGPIGVTVSLDEAKERAAGMVEESFEQWLCAWQADPTD